VAKLPMPSKQQIIAKLLENSVFMPESGLVKQLTAGLLRLSESDLCNLVQLVSVKMRDAADTATQELLDELDKKAEG
jgi:hypothetical protein